MLPTYGPALLIVFSVFVGILLNRRDFDRLDRRMSKLDGDYTTFYGIQQKLEGRVDEISSRVK